MGLQFRNATSILLLLFVTIGCEKHSHSNEPHAPASEKFDTLWSGAEHLELGQLGFNLACTEFGLGDTDCPEAEIYREDQKLDLSYGKIVALGDFYGSADDAFEETKLVAGLERVFKCIDKEGKVHARQETHPEVEYPNCTWVNIFSGAKYLELLSTNIGHFGWHNIVKYIEVHGEAIELALKAHQLRNENKIEEAEYVFNKALFFNAYADHYLTDAFPAGHVRVPRKQIKEWAKTRVAGWFKRYVGDALSNILHEFEGRNRRGKEVGLPVKNSLGQEWITHSDGKMHHLSTVDDPVIKIPTQAVSLSVQEVFAAYFDGVAPEAVYEAINLVPFPSGPSMAENFKLSDSKRANKKWIKRIRKHLAWPLRQITSSNTIKRFFGDLDSIMESMALDVQKDLEENEELGLRMPEPYKENFSNIR